MSHVFTDEQTKAWRAKQPQKMVVVKVVVRSDTGRVLLVKPFYKDVWQLPGGGVEDSESPEEAAVREVKEEINLTLDSNKLAVKGTIYKKDEELLFVIYESSETIPEDTVFILEKDGITGFQFTDTINVAPLLSSYYADFWKQTYGA